MTRRIWAGGGVLVAMLGLAACAPESPLPHDEAVTHYDDTMTAVVTALEDAYPDVAWEVRGETNPSMSSGECRLHVASRWSEQDLGRAAGGWSAVADAVAPALEDAGFGGLTEVSIEGGWTGADATDAHGARIHVSSKGRTSIVLSAPLDAAACA